jgi:DNA-binding response OmpR family regulator
MSLPATSTKILAVDNEPSVTFSLQYIFPKPAYDLTCVDSGDAAMARLDGGFGPYDVIIVDQKMPNQNGVELVEAIRERGIDTDVVVVSAHLSPDTRAAFKSLGVDVMFGKPFEVSEIRSAINDLTAAE